MKSPVVVGMLIVAVVLSPAIAVAQSRDCWDFCEDNAHSSAMFEFWVVYLACIAVDYRTRGGVIGDGCQQSADAAYEWSFLKSFSACLNRWCEV